MDEQEKTDEMLSQTNAAKEQAKQEIEEIERQFNQKITETTTKFDEAKSRHEAKKEKIARENASTGDASKGLGYGLTIAYAIIGAPLAGYGIGYLIDKALGGNAFSAGLTLVGAVAGLWFAITVLNKQNRE